MSSLILDKVSPIVESESAKKEKAEKFGAEKKDHPEKERTKLERDCIDHIAVSVTDIKRAVEWYTSKFNCKVKYQDETWAYLGFGNINLALVIPDQHPTHMAFIREDAEKYGALKTHRDGTRSCYLSDPDGNYVEIMEPYTYK